VQQVQGAGYFYNYWWGPLGRVDHGAAMGVKFGSSLGSAIWWPRRPQVDSMNTVDTVKFNGGISIYGLRADALAQPVGDATHCGKGYALCWSWTGAGNMTFTRIHVDRTLTQSSADTVWVDSTIVFTADKRVASIAGNTVDMSDVKWRWVPDDPATQDTVPCSATGLTCTRAMTYAGTMFVAAYVNGEQQEKSVHLGRSRRLPRRCVDIPGMSTDFPEIANPVMDSVMKKLWRESNYASNIPQANRHERGGWIILTNGVYSFQQMTDPGTPCSLLVTEAPAGAVAFIHTHPWKKGEYGLGTCPTWTSPSYQGKLDGPDLNILLIQRLRSGRVLRGYFIDEDHMLVYKESPIGGRPLLRCGY
jgi:hypothetical protein